jgi:hypothetical protein
LRGVGAAAASTGGSRASGRAGCSEPEEAPGDLVASGGIQAAGVVSSSVVGLVDPSVGEACASMSDGVSEGGGVSSREGARVFFFFCLPDFFPDTGVASGEGEGEEGLLS